MVRVKPEESHTEKIAPLKKPLNSTVSVWAHSNGIYSELYTLLPGLCSTKAEGRLSFLCKQLRHVFKRCAFRLSLRIPQKYPGQQQKKSQSQWVVLVQRTFQSSEEKEELSNYYSKWQIDTWVTIPLE